MGIGVLPLVTNGGLERGEREEQEEGEGEGEGEAASPAFLLMVTRP